VETRNVDALAAEVNRRRRPARGQGCKVAATQESLTFGTSRTPESDLGAGLNLNSQSDWRDHASDRNTGSARVDRAGRS
jgi:hypothetical protein